MTPERWQQVREVLEKALELTPSQRAVFLDGACLSDASLRQEVETLLAASDEVRSSFLQSSALRVTITPGTKLGEYEVKSLLGSGGMGEVYRARDSRLGRDVAIKVLPSFLSTDSDRLRRFEQEARAAAALNHPNILAVHQMGTYQGAPYLVSELLEGETLREQIKRGRLAVRKAIDYGVQIARGLAAAHEKGIVHRDLKPENLFVTKDGRVKILDFGLAKLTQPQSGSESSALTLTKGTEAGMVMGTVGYMAPEQVRGQTADHRADIFAFGAILYEMLAGKRAFQKPTSAETMTAILNEDPPGISQITTNLPPALQRVVHRCLEKSPEQRFQSSSDLAFALDALSESSGSATVYMGDEAGKTGLFPFIEVHKRWLSGFLVGLVLLVTGGGWLWLKGRQSLPPKVMIERQITHNLSDNPIRGSAISPDGKFVAYADHKGLHLTSIQSGESHEIALPDELRINFLDLTWFPDGERLIGDAYNQSEGNVLWLITILGGPPRKLRTHSHDATVSPDGSSIAFISDYSHEIWVAAADGGNAKRILNSETDKFTSLTWSPTGQRLVYIKKFEKGGFNENEGGSIETISLNEGSPSVVVSDPGLYYWNNLAWLRDGRLIFSSAGGSPLGQKLSLWSIVTDSRTGLPSAKPEKMTNWSNVSALYPSVSSDGSRLLVEKAHEWNDTYVSELKENGTRLDSIKPLTSSDSHGGAVGWAHDSGSVLLMSDVMGRYQIFKQKLDTDIPELLVNSPDDQLFAAFSPDAAWILYWSVAHGTSSQGKSQRLMRVPASGGAPEQVLETLVDPMISFSCPSRPSSSCVISRGEHGQLVFYALDPVHGQGKEVIRTTLGQANDLEWSISPDGSQIALGSGTQLRDQLRILDLQGGKERNLPLPKDWFITALSWTADGKALFAGVSDTDLFLARIDLDGKTHVLLERKSGWVGGPISSPDGRHLAYFQQTADRNLWLLENF